MKPLSIIVSFLLIPHILFADQYWQRYADLLIKEQKLAKEQLYTAPFVIEYFDTRITMANELAKNFDVMTQNKKESKTHKANFYKQVLSLCFDKNFIESTRKQVTRELHPCNITFSNTDAIIIHSELVLSSFFKNYELILALNGITQYDTQKIIKKCQPPFDDLLQSIRYQELATKVNFAKQQHQYIASVASLCNTTHYDEEQIRQNPKLTVALLSQLENTISNVPEYSATHNKADGIPYQITIPQLDATKAIVEIQNRREAILTTQNESAIHEIESIAQSYITPIQNQIAEQKNLLAIMKTTDGVTVENEEAFNNFLQRFEMQSKYLRDYTHATTLYCKLALLQAPQIDYSNRCQHIVNIAINIQKLVHSLGDSSQEIIPNTKQVFAVLKAFLYADSAQEHNAKFTTTMQTLHTIQEDIYTMARAKTNDTLSPALCNLEIAMNIATLEKGIKLFSTQTYAQQALMRYASTIQEALESAQTGFSNNTIQQIIAMQSVIPVVENFDVQLIINEYASQQYVLRKLRADTASLIQRIESYKKRGVVINDYEKAKKLAETIKNLQPLYTVDVGKYKMNQNNILIIDRQCVAMLKRMLKKTVAGKI
ncbi:MAG: hypothetical protein ACUVRK_00345 [Spirochaetota bacterium]